MSSAERDAAEKKTENTSNHDPSILMQRTSQARKSCNASGVSYPRTRGQARGEFDGVYLSLGEIDRR
ncbi:hypothetical protein W02_03900 [Nitrospira sp. KM1]|nr:hypothetical protein W02_03900 [Nitrospira sp. KM1]